MHDRPSPFLRMPAIQGGIIHEIAFPLLPAIVHTRFPLCFLEHLSVRFGQQRHLLIITIRNPFEAVFNTKQLHHAPRVRDVRICEQPKPYLRPIKIQQKLAKPGIRFYNVVQRKGVIHLAIVCYRIDLVVFDETRNGEAVILVVPCMKIVCVLWGKREVAYEVVICAESNNIC